MNMTIYLVSYFADNKLTVVNYDIGLCPAYYNRDEQFVDIMWGRCYGYGNKGTVRNIQYDVHLDDFILRLY